MKEKVYVIDTSGFIVGVQFNDGDMVTVPGVVDEIIDSTSRLRFDLMYDAGLKVEPPLGTFKEQVVSAAASTGDAGVLSKTDIEVLAKALELAQNSKVIFITDDYAVQNVASCLELEFKPAGSSGITKKIVWELRCTGCGIVVNYGSECQICGSAIRRRRARH
ncbi:MAG: DNA-binding protein [Methanosarcinales archaeon]|nr:DNA-binding protein [Methanosarcinales archaeon]